LIKLIFFPYKKKKVILDNFVNKVFFIPDINNFFIFDEFKIAT